MALASCPHRFLTGSRLPPAPATRNSRRVQPQVVSCRRSSASGKEDPISDASSSSSSRAGEVKLAKVALVALAAGVLALGSVDEAAAAKSGGRVGGQAFRSRPAAPRSSGPRINNSRTNIFINPPVAPPLIGGYGYGGPFFGGWGWSPFTYFVPGPSVAVGVGGGFDFFVTLLVLGTVASVVRSFLRRRDEDEDDDF